ncbi:DnaJ domain-containing protein [Desulfococcaceae bacterium HSG7]|nr:DnaJ domain-containing protein [Desulfococcaceae bacterium HSG7]
MARPKDYYQTLGIKKNAAPKQIKLAYRDLAFKYHPDRNKENPANAEKMKAVNEAYAVLSNPEKKREYDIMRQQFGSSAHSQFRSTYSERDIFKDSDVHNIFEEMTRAFGFRGFDEIFGDYANQNGRTVKIKKRGPLGFGSVEGFFFSGSLNPDSSNQDTSDRKLFDMPNPASKLSQYVSKKISGMQSAQDGTDIEDTIELNPDLALQGGPYAYLSKKGSKKLVVNIPPGIREGQRIRLAKMGSPGKGTGNAGDLYLKIQIKKSFLQKLKNFMSVTGK